MIPTQFKGSTNADQDMDDIKNEKKNEKKRNRKEIRRWKKNKKRWGAEL